MQIGFPELWSGVPSCDRRGPVFDWSFSRFKSSAPRSQKDRVGLYYSEPTYPNETVPPGIE
ncbi:hypothetical protein NG796_22035 [Laspinema sp. A4]|uniref:hypothetical protein n=1 Tax=Laspinema sp. D2d TaxID=2953686 RepID=UPI0021BADF94|nr:hypothetical protein [Laspinema sp. D2d]MCT7985962.1 hypothetical protein [Laspinema sp. D2d]